MHAATTDQQARIAPGTEANRWPQVIAVAATAGIGSILSASLMAPSGPIGALNVYWTGDETFDAKQQELAELIARHAVSILAEPRHPSESRHDDE